MSVYLLGLISDIHMPINTEARDDSHCHQVFAVKQLGMDDVCSIHISKGGEAIKQMRRERVPVSIFMTSSSSFSHCFKSNKKNSQ